MAGSQRAADPTQLLALRLENVTLALAGVAQPQVLVLDGPAVEAMVERTQPRTGDYDKAPRLGMPI